MSKRKWLYMTTSFMNYNFCDSQNKNTSDHFNHMNQLELFFGSCRKTCCFGTLFSEINRNIS